VNNEDAGMADYISKARRKFLEAGGYGFKLTAAEEREIREAGFEPAPYVEHWEKPIDLVPTGKVP
jgi:hypothetical protein